MTTLRAVLIGIALLSAACGRPAEGGDVTIADLQGPGRSSPLEGRDVVVTGIVTGDFQDGDDFVADDLGGFYLQSEAPDDDPATSDGVFIYEQRGMITDVAAGDRVIVEGRVQEYYGETQIIARSVRKDGKGRIEPADLALPAARTVDNSRGDPVADLEAREGMLVRVPQRLTVTSAYELERFGALVVASGGRLYQFTNVEEPDAGGYRRHREANAARSLILDDGSRGENPAELRFLMTGGDRPQPTRVGDVVDSPVGVLRWSRGSGGRGAENWRLMPVRPPVLLTGNPRPPVPAVGGRLRVASANALNFFPRIDSGAPVCGPRGRDDCRGADSADELRRQQEKLVVMISALGADIVALMELENDGDNALATLGKALNAHDSGGWSYVATGSIGDDAIRTGFLYRGATVALAGRHAILDRSVDPGFDDGHNRPVLAQSFRERATGEVLTVVVHHLKSKGSDCDDSGDPNTGDGQGNCNRTRVAALQSVVRWLAADPTGSDDPDVLLLGDFNAYAFEDPLRVLHDAGYVDLRADADPPAWSFVYDAQSGALDHAFASASLARQVAGAAEWHVNADEAPLQDYNLEHGRNPAIARGPWRASDHDPLLVGLDLGAGPPP
mgnify:CR=1 FL=1